MELHGTTIVGVKKDGKCAIAGDGQVTLGEQVVMKATAKKVRRIYHDLSLIHILMGQRIVKRWPRAKAAFIALAIVALLLFALFYPVWSGAMIDRAWALKWLRWMPSWWFF